MAGETHSRMKRNFMAMQDITSRINKTLQDALPKALRVEAHVSDFAKQIEAHAADIDFMDQQLGNSEKE